jgi:Fic family protein
MILNNYHAMQFIREYRKDPLTPSIVLELHKILAEKTLDHPKDAGKYRTETDDVHVVDGVGDVLYTPPNAKELPERMERLCRFANSSASDMFIHPVIKAILLHFALAFDHPFVDGNGRTARALFYWSTASQGYWLMEFISISRIIKHAPAKYAKEFLHTETDDNDTTYFIIHQLNVIKKAINELKTFLDKKVQDIKTAEQLLEGAANLRAKLNYRQLALLRHAFKSPGFIYRINEHQQSHGIAYDTARNDLLVMSDKFKLLDKAKEGKSFIFVSPPNLIQRIEKAKKLIIML